MGYLRISMTVSLFMILYVVLIKLAMAEGISSPTGKPLFLTPYIENGDVETGRILSRVGPLPNATSSVTSYSGFITINKEYNSNTFFWFFPAMVSNLLLDNSHIVCVF
ncbi:hypothetical protein JTE90_006019 [Oedothorax gibbosus]|uniref:Uncharacterized protein n=1 Tax=Oedothorax gibbosus TaxID=931172 RepID=A0AAV6TG57_9ARAC|nr:hypothetical protein JTE90_006019 [Oedothorax gibbosus]